MCYRAICCESQSIFCKISNSTWIFFQGRFENVWGAFKISLPSLNATKLWKQVLLGSFCTLQITPAMISQAVQITFMEEKATQMLRHDRACIPYPWFRWTFHVPPIMCCCVQNWNDDTLCDSLISNSQEHHSFSQFLCRHGKHDGKKPITDAFSSAKLCLRNNRLCGFVSLSPNYIPSSVQHHTIVNLQSWNDKCFDLGQFSVAFPKHYAASSKYLPYSILHQSLLKLLPRSSCFKYKIPPQRVPVQNRCTISLLVMFKTHGPSKETKHSPRFLSLIHRFFASTDRGGVPWRKQAGSCSKRHWPTRPRYWLCRISDLCQEICSCIYMTVATIMMMPSTSRDFATRIVPSTLSSPAVLLYKLYICLLLWSRS